jgi:hypothetical protein
MQTSRKLTHALLSLFALVVMSALAFAQTDLSTATQKPGAIYPPQSEVSDQKAGSVLIYNFYSAGATDTEAITNNTRINITNTSTTSAVTAHFFFIDGTNCAVADASICLTAQQTASFLMSDLDPGFRGYIVVVAVDQETGCPIAFNHLIGDEFVKTVVNAIPYAANLAAEAFSALWTWSDHDDDWKKKNPPKNPNCDESLFTTILHFSGQAAGPLAGYNRLPRVLAADNIGSFLGGNNTLVIINRISGNLHTGAFALGALFGLFFDDAENVLSFSISGPCQLRERITDSFPRLVPRFTNFVPQGRTGWAKIWRADDSTSSPGGILGAMITSNAAAATDKSAFNGGHNLHKLTLATAVQTSATNLGNAYVMPLFAPGC